ncbi:MAG TPA: hypothetical protein VKT82_28790 [Ktedonobacterales bacterium]|nr:hypothetical protein [Ktedonobacterales bacterium]
MGIESGGKPQPFRPAFQQFEPGGTGAAGNGERRGGDLSGGAVLSPIATDLVRLMREAQQTRRGRGFTDFYPQWWMYSQIVEGANDYSPRFRRRMQSESGRRGLRKAGINPDVLNSRQNISDGELRERQRFFSTIASAYGIAAYDQFTPRQKDQLRKELREQITVEGIGNVTLSEHQQQVLAQIASATETPVHPDQTTYHFYTVLQQPDITEEAMEKDPRYSTW